jgi:uroporphyrinogen-III synthase
VGSASFDGLRVLSLESRRAVEVAKLIRTYGGEPLVVPSMRELPLESNTEALDFADRLLAGEFELVVFFTGVGVRTLVDIVQTRHDREEFLQALRRVKIAARGPKPGAVLRELNVPVAVTAAEPSTWRELMVGMEAKFCDELGKMRVAVQEYGASNPEFLAELASKCAAVTRVPVYQWALPEDIGPLRECVVAIANGGLDVVLFMTAVQVVHLFQIAVEMGREDGLRAGLASMVIVSIGPTTSEELARYGLTPDFEPSHPKMGFIVNEAAQRAGGMLREKIAAKDLR